LFHPVSQANIAPCGELDPKPFVSSQIGILAHYQAANCRPATSVPKSVGLELLRRLAAEPIRQGVIRLMPPGSVCMKAAAPFAQTGTKEPHFNVVGGEIGGVKFVYRRSSSIAEVCKLPRYREVFGENQMRASL
jgi:hypothetical protein